MARILGLDLGAHSVKALLLESSFRGATVRRFTQVKREGEEGLAAALAALKEGGHLDADQVVLAAPGLSVATQLVSLPFTDARRVEATIAFELEGQLPYDLTEVAFDHQILTNRGGKSEILVGTVRKEDLAALLSQLASFGVDPRVVTTAAVAYQNVLAHLEAPAPPSPGEPDAEPAAAEPEGVEAIVDIGHERTALCMGRPRGGLELARTFAGGGRELTAAIAAEFQVSLEDAEAWKEAEGDVWPEEGAPPEMVRAARTLQRALAPLVRELRATLRAHFARYRKPLRRVWITGGTSRLKGLSAYLARELGVAVAPLQALPPEAASAVPEAQAPAASLCWALALRGHGSARQARFNLRKGEFAFKGDLDYLKGKTSRLAIFATVLLVLAGASVWAQLRGLAQRERSLDKMLCETTTRIIGQCQKDYLVALSLLKGKGSPAAALPELSALDLFAELSARSQSAKFTLEEVEVQTDRIHLRGITESFEGVDQVVSELKGHRCFQDIKRGKVQKTRTGSQVQFDLDIRVQCGASATEGA